jgi:hypothetical protein
LKAVFEITDRYLEAGDCSALLYAPLDQDLSYRQTRRYSLDFEGDEAAVVGFVVKTLLDEVGQELHQGDEAALNGYLFAIDYGMKPGALDLEKEAVVAFYQNLKAPGFELNDLKLEQRVYVFGEGDASPDRFVRDICNPAIHTWSVIDGAKS